MFVRGGLRSEQWAGLSLGAASAQVIAEVGQRGQIDPACAFIVGTEVALAIIVGLARLPGFFARRAHGDFWVVDRDHALELWDALGVRRACFVFFEATNAVLVLVAVEL